jgi:hypothetical protein
MLTKLEKLELLLSDIRTREYPLNMSTWARDKSGQAVTKVKKMLDCGTPCCLAGEAAARACQYLPYDKNTSIFDMATKWLEIGSLKASRLFDALSTSSRSGFCTAEEAIDRVEKLILEEKEQ